MKKNWKFALMAIATLTMVACDPQNQPDGGGDDNDDEDPVFVSLISTADNSFADWDNLPAQYVASATSADGAEFNALKSVKVYKDQQYLNLLVEYNEEKITDKSWVPFHIYINADNSDATGGYGDEFADANTDILLEGGIFSEGAYNNYDPAVFKWWGGVGENGWLWTDPNVEGDESNFWGALVGEGQGAIGSSFGQGNRFEIQLLLELIPDVKIGTTIGVGIDIQQEWTSVGVLPNAANDATTGAVVYAKKLTVETDPTFYGE